MKASDLAEIAGLALMAFGAVTVLRLAALVVAAALGAFDPSRPAAPVLLAVWAALSLGLAAAAPRLGAVSAQARRGPVKTRQ